MRGYSRALGISEALMETAAGGYREPGPPSIPLWFSFFEDIRDRHAERYRGREKETKETQREETETDRLG